MYVLDGNQFLIKYFGIIFILAGIIRIFLPTERKKELINMNLIDNFDIVIILIEIIFGFMLLFNLGDNKIK